MFTSAQIIPHRMVGVHVNDFWQPQKKKPNQHVIILVLTVGSYIHSPSTQPNVEKEQGHMLVPVGRYNFSKWVALDPSYYREKRYVGSN